MMELNALEQEQDGAQAPGATAPQDGAQAPGATAPSATAPHQRQMGATAPSAAAHHKGATAPSAEAHHLRHTSATAPESRKHKQYDKVLAARQAKPGLTLPLAEDYVIVARGPDQPSS
jgi:hypothetical protein